MRLEFWRAFLFEHQSAEAGDDERQNEFQQIIARGGFSPLEDKPMKTLMKEGNDRDDRAGLDDDIEEVGLARQPMFRDEEMAGGRDGEEFRDSFDDSQNQDADPVRHPMYRREISPTDKPEILLAAKKHKVS